ncbi:hypothetical protein McpSp1_14300 [Methanocorpusculaceae archaeon Sp1]|uniref:Uncharacterized protein n=1 Tax=Methanorbis furvi TaxID=3028299 RepID=A0AAE4MDB2_9EURY|nr:hypothetical protein [Methanocorpusculaceae archaeon Sp1]MDV0441418.1 hypothetical protein [Methanocorpusculaceae archaeon Ag1]
MSKKNTIVGVILVVACVLCVWYVSMPKTEEFSASGTVEVLGGGTVISGDDGTTYIPISGVPVEFDNGVRVSFTAVLNTSDDSMYRGHYKPIDLVSVSRG